MHDLALGFVSVFIKYRRIVTYAFVSSALTWRIITNRIQNSLFRSNQASISSAMKRRSEQRIESFFLRHNIAILRCMLFLCPFFSVQCRMPVFLAFFSNSKYISSVRRYSHFTFRTIGRFWRVLFLDGGCNFCCGCLRCTLHFEWCFYWVSLFVVSLQQPVLFCKAANRSETRTKRFNKKHTPTTIWCIDMRTKPNRSVAFLTVGKCSRRKNDGKNVHIINRQQKHSV